MAFLKTKRSQFLAWMFIYALAVALISSKGGDSLMGFLWGLALGVGAGIATNTKGPEKRLQRLRLVLLWFLGAWLFGTLLQWDEFGPRGGAIGERLQTSLLVTLIFAFPALLALLVWIFRRPKTESAAAAAPSSS